MPIVIQYYANDKIRMIDPKGTPEEVYEKAIQHFNLYDEQSESYQFPEGDPRWNMDDSAEYLG